MRAILLAAALAAALFGTAAARPMRMVESSPVASAVIGTRSSEFFVRFDGPVDHRRSFMTITRNGQIIETLRPRLDARPSVLFARAPRLDPGDYVLHWSVLSMQGADVTQGNVPFRVSAE